METVLLPPPSSGASLHTVAGPLEEVVVVKPWGDLGSRSSWALTINAIMNKSLTFPGQQFPHL